MRDEWTREEIEGEKRVLLSGEGDFFSRHKTEIERDKYRERHRGNMINNDTTTTNNNTA